MKIAYSIFLFVLFFLKPISLFSQYFELGIGIGGSLYYGDLSPDKKSNNFKLIRTSIGIFGSHHFNRKWALQMDIQNLTLEGNDSNNKQSDIGGRNLSFRSKIWEFNFKGVYYLIGFDPFDAPFGFFLSTGISVFHHNPKAFYGGKYVALQPLGTEGQGLPSSNQEKYSLFKIGIPIMGGFKYAFSEGINFFIEFGPRFVFFDYLDDVSKNYANKDELLIERGPIALALSYRTPEINPELTTYPSGLQRGNALSNDFYMSGLAGCSINIDNIFAGMFRKTVNCPSF